MLAVALASQCSSCGTALASDLWMRMGVRHALSDPTFYKEGVGASARQYVLWKSDGNAIGKPTPIHIAELDATGTSVTGT